MPELGALQADTFFSLGTGITWVSLAQISLTLKATSGVLPAALGAAQQSHCENFCEPSGFFGGLSYKTLFPVCVAQMWLSQMRRNF